MIVMMNLAAFGMLLLCGAVMLDPVLRDKVGPGVLFGTFPSMLGVVRAWQAQDMISVGIWVIITIILGAAFYLEMTVPRARHDRRLSRSIVVPVTLMDVEAKLAGEQTMALSPARLNTQPIPFTDGPQAEQFIETQPIQTQHLVSV